MGFPGDSTWMVRSGGTDTFALYVRDAVGVSTPTATAIPPLTPAVARTDVPVPDTFAADWDHWWTEHLGGGTAGTGSDDVPALWPEGLPAHLPEEHRRWLVRLREHEPPRQGLMEPLYEVIEDLTRELGHEPVFVLDLIQLPVQGEFWRRARPGTVLVSYELMRSRHIIAPLESVIRELVVPPPRS